MNTKELQITANTLRQDILTMLHIAKSGHSAGALGLADIFAVLYFDILNIDPKNPICPKRDFVILSNGHVCPVLYSALANRGFFKKEELLNLRKYNSLLQGHPHINPRIGIENSSGPLGQGISTAVGLAASLKRDNKKNYVYCFIGDGEMQEGQVWEAFMFAAKEKLDNLIIIIDRNNIQIDGNTKDVVKLEPLNKKLVSFNLASIEIDGNNIKQIKTAIHHAKQIKSKPTVIIAKTIPGKGVSFMQNNFIWHGKTPNDEEYQKAIKELKEERNNIK